jgi:S-DNA-T family DNA segregation ATPase FtsK/SpoIIIE
LNSGAEVINSGLDFLWKFWRSGRGRDFIGILLILFSLLSLLALIGLTSGVWISNWADTVRSWFGWGSIFVIAAGGAAGLLIMQQDRGKFEAKDWRRVIWLEISAFSLMALFSILGGDSLARAESGLDGGLIGWGYSRFVAILLRSLPDGISLALRVLLFILFAIL